MPMWRPEIPTEGSVELTPDRRALDALGRNHSLETALADLVDNSIDARASRVLIRFVRDGARLVALYVVDDGHGITPDDIDAAMTVGGRRSYTDSDLGRFGLGLKAASFSQATSLTVLSRAAGHDAVGRRWQLDPGRHGYQCDKVPAAFAALELDRAWPSPLQPSGTVVRWDAVHNFPSMDDPEHVEEYLGRTISHLQGHLGLMFHRILAGGAVGIRIDVEDIVDGVGIPYEVDPLDPFGYPQTLPGWPKTLVADLDGRHLELHCHLWPRRSNAPQYRLPGGAEHRQGIYFYRRDRLLQAGGWEGVHAPDKKLQLARAAIDIDDDVARLFVMNAEKSRVTAGADFARTVSAARASDGTSISDYLAAAETAWTVSNRRTTAQREAVFPPGRGLHPAVGRQIRDELPQRPEPPLNILWKALGSDDFFQVDRTGGTLWINQIYRRPLLGGRHGGLNDLPMVKALLFLLTEQVFAGSHLGPRDKDNIELWQEILTTAAKVEKATYEARS